MSQTLLATKLFLPKPRPDLVPRPRLIDRLNARVGGNLTLVSAPAGFGKTSLVSVWSHQSDQPVTWISLDENDNDLTHFLNYIIAALGKLDESLGDDVLATLDSSQSPQTEILLTLLVNDIARVEHPFTLVLDDCHLITSQSTHDALDFIINHLPPHMHLVIISRVDPPIPFSRLRAGGQLVEIRSKDLRFTEAEVAAFLNDLMGFDLSIEDIRALEKRTEGWIAGLQLAALSLQGRADKHAFVAEFSGSHHYIIDYLLEEVLSQQPPEIRSFLCRTSILDRFNAPLCDAILEGNNSRQIIQTLEETNLFLIPLDDQRNWYRYHHLFSDFLKQCLAEDEPERISGLHRRAAGWYARKGHVSEAVRHALASEDYQEAANLVEQSAAQLLEKSELAALMKLVDMLPEEEMGKRPRLCIYHTWALRLSGRPYDVVEARLQDANRALENQKILLDGATEKSHLHKSDDLFNLGCHITALRAFQALFREDIPQVMELAQQVQACCPEENFLCSSTAFALGWAYRFSGDLEAANRNFLESTSLAREAGNIYFAVATQCRAAYALELAGKLRQANECFLKAVGMATRDAGRRLPVAGYAYVYLGGIYYEWNDLPSAERYLVEGIELCERVGYFMDQAVGCVYLARLKQAQGDLHGAHQTLQTAEQLSQRMKGYLYVQRWVEDGLVRFWLAQGNQEKIERWVNSCGLGIEDAFDFKRDMEHIILARALVGLGDNHPDKSYIQDALPLLTRLFEMAKTAGWIGKVIEILVLKAKALQIKGEEKAALKALERALVLARPEGYVRTFIDEGPQIAALLLGAAIQGVLPKYTGMLLKALDAQILSTTQISTTPSMIDPLSPRELEVLKLLATDLSGPEIARELTIALTTVRFHTRNIYSKLNANNRRIAIRKAKDLKLI